MQESWAWKVGKGQEMLGRGGLSKMDVDLVLIVCYAEGNKWDKVANLGRGKGKKYTKKSR